MMVHRRNRLHMKMSMATVEDGAVVATVLAAYRPTAEQTIVAVVAAVVATLLAAPVVAALVVHRGYMSRRPWRHRRRRRKRRALFSWKTVDRSGVVIRLLPLAYITF